MKKRNLLALTSIITASGIVKYESNKYKSSELVECLEKNTEYTQNLFQRGLADATQTGFREDNRLEKLSQVHTWIALHL